MIIELFASLLLGLAPLPADTVIQVRPGDRVEVQNLSGRILVETWDRDEVSTDVQGRSERAGARARRLSWGVVVVGQVSGGAEGRGEER